MPCHWQGHLTPHPTWPCRLQMKILDLDHLNNLIFKSMRKLNKPDSWCWMEVALCLRNSSLKLSKFLLTKIFCISWVRTLLTISGRLLWSDTRRGKVRGGREAKKKKKKKRHLNNCRKHTHQLLKVPVLKFVHRNMNLRSKCVNTNIADAFTEETVIKGALSYNLSITSSPHAWLLPESLSCICHLFS